MPRYATRVDILTTLATVC